MCGGRGSPSGEAGAMSPVFLVRDLHLPVLAGRRSIHPHAGHSMQGAARSLQGPYAQCRAVRSVQEPCAQKQGPLKTRTVRAQCRGRTLNARGRTLNARGSYAQCRGRTLNAGVVRSMQGPYAQCRAVRPMQGRTPNAGPYAQCRAVRPMQGRTPNAGPYAQCRAVRPMQGRTPNAGPNAQCRAVRPMQGRTPNAGPYAQCRAVRPMQGPYAQCRGRTLNAGAIRSMQAFFGWRGGRRKKRLKTKLTTTQSPATNRHAGHPKAPHSLRAGPSTPAGTLSRRDKALERAAVQPSIALQRRTSATWIRPFKMRGVLLTLSEGKASQKLSCLAGEPAADFSCQDDQACPPMVTCEVRMASLFPCSFLLQRSAAPSGTSWACSPVPERDSSPRWCRWLTALL